MYSLTARVLIPELGTIGLALLLAAGLWVSRRRLRVHRRPVM